MVIHRRGGVSRLGCLFAVLIVAAIGYFGLPVGEAYYRYFRLRDAMAQELRFAETRTPDEIRERLRSVADSLHLPPEAARFSIRREAQRMIIETSYSEEIVLPGRVRDLTFRPRVERTF